MRNQYSRIGSTGLQKHLLNFKKPFGLHFKAATANDSENSSFSNPSAKKKKKKSSIFSLEVIQSNSIQ